MAGYCVALVGSPLRLSQDVDIIARQLYDGLIKKNRQ